MKPGKRVGVVVTIAVAILAMLVTVHLYRSEKLAISG